VEAPSTYIWPSHDWSVSPWVNERWRNVDIYAVTKNWKSQLYVLWWQVCILLIDLRLSLPCMSWDKESKFLLQAYMSFSAVKNLMTVNSDNHYHNRLRPFFRDYLGEPVPKENFWTLWCKGRLTGRQTGHPAGRHSIRTKQCQPPPSPIFFTAECPCCHPTNSVKALKATSAFRLGRRR